jgi:hypothetical protein
MNAEHKASIKAGRDAASAHYAQQTIKIDENWTIKRGDELNWQIFKKGKFYGFYGSLQGAFMALPAAMLGEEAKNSLQLILESQNDINRRIVAAISNARKNPFI